MIQHDSKWFNCHHQLLNGQNTCLVHKAYAVFAWPRTDFAALSWRSKSHAWWVENDTNPAEWAWIHWPHALGYPAGSAGYNESSDGFSKENPRSQKGKYGVLPLQLLIAQDNCIARMYLRRRDPESLFFVLLGTEIGFRVFHLDPVGNVLQIIL